MNHFGKTAKPFTLNKKYGTNVKLGGTMGVGKLNKFFECLEIFNNSNVVMIYSRTNASMIYVATKKKVKTYMDESYSIIDEVEILVSSVISPKSKSAVK